MKISSPVFKDGEEIARRYTCDGLGISPPLKFSKIPGRARSLVLMVDDPDAPSGNFTHWIVWNIDPIIKKAKEGNVPNKGIEGLNSAGRSGYLCPCGFGTGFGTGFGAGLELAH